MSKGTLDSCITGFSITSSSLGFSSLVVTIFSEFSGAFFTSAVSLMAPNNAPTSTVDPSGDEIFSINPEAGEGTSRVTLSVSNSSSGSSNVTLSPSFLYHLATVASTTLSPRDGTFISTDILII